MTKILLVENWQEIDEFEPIYLDNYRYWWKLVSGFWAHYQALFFWLCLFTPTWILFFLFCFFLLTFVFFFPCYLLLNRKTHCIPSLSDWRYQEGLLCDWNRGCHVKESSSTGSSKIFNFKTIRVRWIKFSKWVDIKNKLNLTKIGDGTVVVNIQIQKDDVVSARLSMGHIFLSHPISFHSSWCLSHHMGFPSKYHAIKGNKFLKI